MTRLQVIERHARICTLRREGLKLVVIAERVGLSLKQVQRVLTKHGVYKRRVRP